MNKTLYSVINIIIIYSRPLCKAKISTLFSQGRNLRRHIAVDCLKGSNICSRPLCKAKISTLFSQGRNLRRHIAVDCLKGSNICSRPLCKAKVSTLFSQGRNLRRHIAAGRNLGGTLPLNWSSFLWQIRNCTRKKGFRAVL